MSAVLNSSAQSFLSRYEGLRARLPGCPETRAAAAAVFRANGLPGVQDEAWRYTNLRPLTETAFYEPLVEVGEHHGSRDARITAQLPDLACSRIVFVDGRFRADLSTVPDSIGFSRFGEHPEFSGSVQADRQPLVALNTMLAEDGAMFDVPAGVDGGVVMLASLASELPGQAVAFHPRHRIRLGAGAKLTVLDVSVGVGTYLHNPVTEVQVASDAVLTHIRLQNEAVRAFHLSTLYADIAARGTYDSFLLTLGARLARVEVHARLHGDGGAVHLNGAQLLTGDQHGDFTTVVSHDAPHCASRQTVKNVLSGRSRGVFQGKIEVARAAQKTDGYQMNQALLLSPDAEIDCKPQLEIYADDVKCSHGATVGELDAEQLFYLRSRGVPESEARAILVRAFLAEALDPIANDAVRQVLEDAIETWWSTQSA